MENWQVSHFRLLGNDAFLPYGSSVLEGARRVWRQLILIEDAMLVYRVIRSPERRVFYIDVGNIPPENVADYLEQAQTALKRNAVVDKTTGQVDLRYNPLSVDEDYFLPVRGGESGTRIDTLAGGSNTTAIEDVEYIQKKLFAALKIPKAYLGYDEDIGAKATLAQEDIRFSRTIQRIQKTIISELNKVAMIHLYTHGYSEEDLLNFDLRLSNPSSIAQQQKLDLIRTKFEISSQAPEGIVDREWIRKHILDLNNDEIRRIESGKEKDKIRDMELENVRLPETNQFSFGDEEPGEGESGEGDFGGGEGGFGGEEEAGGEGGGLEGLFASDMKSGNLMSEDELSEYDSLLKEDDDDDISEKAREKAKNSKGVNVSNRENRDPYKKTVNTTTPTGDNPYALHKRTPTGSGALIVPNDNSKSRDLLNSITAGLMDGIMPQSPVVEKYIDKHLNHRMSKSLDDMSKKLNINQNKASVILESNVNKNDILTDDDILIDDDIFEDEEK
jgi:hypothetical protein